VASFIAGMSEFIIGLSEISAGCVSYWLNISIAFQSGTQRCSDYALSSVWPRFRLETQSAVRLSIPLDHFLFAEPKIEFQRDGNNRDH
jgi:hypothetical protein